jgi:hypothetical protein
MFQATAEDFGVHTRPLSASDVAYNDWGSSTMTKLREMMNEVAKELSNSK